MKNKVSVIVPVYGDWPSLEKNIIALKKYVGRFSGHNVYFVNDRGPDYRKIEEHILHKIRYRKNFHYVLNDENMGFVRNCNNAVENIISKSHDVLLLNSDARPTKNFLKSLSKVLSKEDIAAVSPRSNNATIFSVPMFRSENETYTAEESVRIYNKIKPKLPQYYLSPTVHGFCMLIKRDVINEFGLFDEIYGMGYGEENDFCMRVGREGWNCAIVNTAYVFHEGEKSFSATEINRTEVLAINEKILDTRYPEYREKIGKYIESVSEEEKRY